MDDETEDDAERENQPAPIFSTDEPTDNEDQLEALKLDNNQLSSLPANISKMRSLEYLSVRNNKITALSESLASMQKPDKNISGNTTKSADSFRCFK